MSNLSIFNFRSIHQIRVQTDEQQNFWFCATDVCDVLGYANCSQSLKDHCVEKGVSKRYTLTDGGKQELAFINEGNLYRLIIKSKKPEARTFESWVCDEVLPAIRKTGTYTLSKIQEQKSASRPASVLEVRQITTAIHSLARYFSCMGNQTIYSNMHNYLKKEFKINSLSEINIEQLKIALEKIKEIEHNGWKLYTEYSKRQANLFFSYTNPCRMRALELDL